MIITLKPIDFVNINHFSQTERISISHGNNGTYYVMLYMQSSDNRFVPPPLTNLQIKFPRSPTITAKPVSRDIIVPLILEDQRDASIYKFTITAEQANTIISGGAQLVAAFPGETKIFKIDNLVRKVGVYQ